jgi:hypothetical protein
MRCPACDSPNPPEAVRCEECGKKLPPPKPRRAADLEGEDEDEEPPVARVKRAESAGPRPRRRRPEDFDEDEEDEDDEEYERRPRRRVRRDEDDGGISTLIPYKNPKALAGYYCGFFALIPVIGLLLAPVALVLGILGVRARNANPEVKGTAHAIVGIVLGTLSLLCNPALIFIYVWYRKNL